MKRYKQYLRLVQEHQKTILAFSLTALGVVCGFLCPKLAGSLNIPQESFYIAGMVLTSGGLAITLSMLRDSPAPRMIKQLAVKQNSKESAASKIQTEHKPEFKPKLHKAPRQQKSKKPEKEIQSDQNPAATLTSSQKKKLRKQAKKKQEEQEQKAKEQLNHQPAPEIMSQDQPRSTIEIQHSLALPVDTTEEKVNSNQATSAITEAKPLHNLSKKKIKTTVRRIVKKIEIKNEISTLRQQREEADKKAVQALEAQNKTLTQLTEAQQRINKQQSIINSLQPRYNRYPRYQPVYVEQNSAVVPPLVHQRNSNQSLAHAR